MILTEKLTIKQFTNCDFLTDRLEVSPDELSSVNEPNCFCDENL